MGKPQLWSEALAGLGLDIGICGSDAVRWGGACQEIAAKNLTALTTLEKERTEIDLPALIKRLYTPIQNMEDDLRLHCMKLAPRY